MEDRIGARALHQAVHRPGVAQVHLGQLGATRQRAVEVLPPAGGDVVEDRDLIPPRQQGIYEVRADEAGSACDQSSHEADDGRRSCGRGTRSPGAHAKLRRTPTRSQDARSARRHGPARGCLSRVSARAAGGCEARLGCRPRRGPRHPARRRSNLRLPDASFALVTGCQMAHLTGLAAARHRVLADAGWDVEGDGLIGAPSGARPARGGAPRRPWTGPCGCSASVPPAWSRWPWAMTARCVRTSSRERLAAGSGPAVVCAQAGNVNTGAVDPLDAVVRRSARLRGLGARGRRLRALGERQPVVTARCCAACERADSWATDGHKWLNVPYDCGIAVVADRDAHRGRHGGAGQLPPAGRVPARAVGLDSRVLAPGTLAARVRGAALARAQRRGRAGGSAVCLRRTASPSASPSGRAWRCSPTG